LLKKDTYNTILKPSPETIFKDRGSKFLGYTFPLEQEEDVKKIIQDLKDSHFKARHWCYAWRLGKSENDMRIRVNDDGEPSNSAGQPIYGQILSKELTNILVVVVRYFGGSKLGVGGLVNAYRTAAEMAIEASSIVVKTIDVKYRLIFEYKEMNKVMHVIKERNLAIISQKMEMNCDFEISVRKNEAENVKNIFENLRCVKIKQF
jgi:uncharacterized YigZ family protein